MDLIQLAAFKLNQVDITNALCINKDKPAMKCDGKCFLNKTLSASKEAKQEKPIPPPDEKSPLVLNPDSLFAELTIFPIKKCSIFNYMFPYSLTENEDIPHPPELFI
jgi:hypothetical protein